MDFAPVPTRIIVGCDMEQSAGGDMMPYYNVRLVADVGNWRCERRIVSGEHWHPSIDRAVIESMNEYGIATDMVFDCRED